jgi:peptidoglycan hydrolase CwlO-like protein
MLKRSVIVASVLAIGFVLGFGTLAFTQDKKPTATRAGLHLIHAAAKSLEDAEKHLQRAEHHFGGHRAKALELVKQAEGELKQAVEYAKANPPAPSKPTSTTTPAATPAPATPPPPPPAKQ